MDLINNLIFTALNNIVSTKESTKTFKALEPRFVDLQLPKKDGKTEPRESDKAIYYLYYIDVIQQFSSFDDSDFIDDAIQKHWADMVFGRNYTNGKTVPDLITYSTFRNPDGKLIPPYHLIYAYLVENTRIAQIFEKLLYLYMHDEKLNKATTEDNRTAFQWMINTENLFFKTLPNSSYRNISSMVRLSPDATRRNAYFRLLGMDLAFGDINSDAPVNFYKAEFNNLPFIVLFERFLTEIWQAYTNAKNASGPNTTDMFSITDTGQKIQEMLMSRRTTEADFENYRYFNLSKEEYSSVVMMSWLYEVISYESPLVHFLKCNGNTPGERLINIGNKVGIKAHSKSEGLLDIAPPMNTLLRRIEFGDYSKTDEVKKIIESQASGTASESQKQALVDILSIINNWEKATGHRIKNPEARVNGTLKIEQKAGKPVLLTN